MMGDGKTSYDVGTDGAQTELAGCSVRSLFFFSFLRVDVEDRGFGRWVWKPLGKLPKSRGRYES